MTLEVGADSIAGFLATGLPPAIVIILLYLNGKYNSSWIQIGFDSGLGNKLAKYALPMGIAGGIVAIITPVWAAALIVWGLTYALLMTVKRRSY